MSAKAHISVFASLLLLLAGLGANAQNPSESGKYYSVSGTVYNKTTGEPVEFATVILTETGQWAVADAKGAFSINKVQAGKTVISISCMGFVTDSKEIIINKDIANYKIYLKEDNLALESAVVTAQTNENSATTSRTIDKTALDHVQLVNVSDITSLLPGGATVNPTLTSDQNIAIRSTSSEAGNSTFGTAIEVDGVRLSSNASFGSSLDGTTSSSVKGATTNSIASSNIESVEVITGVPSVEYGDMTSGIVKVNTRKGVTPWTVTMSTAPKLKQVSFSKGFGLGTTRKGYSRGVLNASAEYTNSVSQEMSPYTAYDRKQLTLTYSNLFNRGILADHPLRFTVSATGNMGGYNSESDPDLITDTYYKKRENSIRGNFTLDCLLSQPWITNVELNGSISYSDKLQRYKTYNSSAVSKTVLHGTEEGYYLAEAYDGTTLPVQYIDPGYWYDEMFLDDRPLSFKLAAKANWARNFGQVNNKLKLGVDWTGDYNFGRGEYAEDMSTAPTFREYTYYDKPMMHNVAVYLEENLLIPVGSGRINLIAGLRNDNTIIRGSDYGTTSSWSPRFNAKYTVIDPKGRSKKLVRSLSFRGGWGLAVKLPSYSVLYPQPTYYDIRTFASTTNSDNMSYMVYHIQPKQIEYNADLKWQKNMQSEIGMDINLGGNKISLVAFYNRTMNSYITESFYSETFYNMVAETALMNCSIPIDDRTFSVDKETGLVTVSDKTGANASEELEMIRYDMYVSGTRPGNLENPIHRYGIEWVVDFAKIDAINTSIRFDGTWYGYKYLNTNLLAYSPYTTRAAGSDTGYYKYVGWYYGGNSTSNGTETQTVKANVTLTTHIPQVRMIISLKLETSLLRYSRSLSDRLDGTARAYVLDDNSNLLSYNTEASIYDGDNYVVVFPDYYSVYGDDTLYPYLEALTAAKETDSDLYNDLAKLAYTTSYTYVFKKDFISPYFSANISVTKEIGDIASISFYANNFFNNRQQVKSTKTGTYYSASSYIPSFYYGLTLRLKF